MTLGSTVVVAFIERSVLVASIWFWWLVLFLVSGYGPGFGVRDWDLVLAFREVLWFSAVSLVSKRMD